MKTAISYEQLGKPTEVKFDQATVGYYVTGEREKTELRNRPVLMYQDVHNQVRGIFLDTQAHIPMNEDLLLLPISKLHLSYKL